MQDNTLLLCLSHLDPGVITAALGNDTRVRLKLNWGRAPSLALI